MTVKLDLTSTSTTWPFVRFGTQINQDCRRNFGKLYFCFSVDWKKEIHDSSDERTLIVISCLHDVTIRCREKRGGGSSVNGKERQFVKLLRASSSGVSVESYTKRHNSSNQKHKMKRRRRKRSSKLTQFPSLQSHTQNFANDFFLLKGAKMKKKNWPTHFKNYLFVCIMYIIIKGMTCLPWCKHGSITRWITIEKLIFPISSRKRKKKLKERERHVEKRWRKSKK